MLEGTKMKFSEFQNAATTNAPPAATPAAQTKNAPLDPKTRAGAAAVSRALGGKPNAKFAQAIDQAEKGKALNPSLLQSLAPFAGALEKIFADPALRTKFLAMVKLVKAVENVTEDQDSIDAVSSAVTRRIMMQHTDLLGKYGPVKVMAAINDVADFAGSDGLEEIGSSDVSIWTKQVIQDLEAGHYDRMESAEQLDEILPAIGAAVGRAVVGSGASAVTRSVAGGVGHVAGTMAQDALGDSDEDPTDADSENDEVDTVTLDVPLLLRMMEYAREDAQEDMDLHNAAERMIELSKNGALSMDDYESIVGDVEALPAPDKVGEDSGKSKQYIEIVSLLGHTKRVPVHPLNAYKALNHYRDQPSTKSARIVSEEQPMDEGYYAPGPEIMPGAVGPQETTTVSFNQSKQMGDATLNINASAKDMEELHRILKLAGINYDTDGDEQEPSMQDVAVALEPHAPEAPAEEPCGCEDEMPADVKYSTDKQTLINVLRDKLQKRLA